MTDVKGLITASSSSHWYLPTGEPAFEVPSADGKKMVKTNITHARKMGLYPSITTVLRILNKEALTTWKLEQMLRSALLVKRGEGEEEHLYFARIIEESERIGNVARDYGNLVHKYCEYLLKGNPASMTIDIPNETKVAIMNFVGEHIMGSEPEVRVINSALGYAGTADLICEFDGKKAVLDFKNQATTDKDGKHKDPTYYDDWGYQLGAEMMCDPTIEIAVSVVISRTEHGHVEFKSYTREEMSDKMETFEAILKVFKMINKIGRTK